jgi:hypothetical protein
MIYMTSDSEIGRKIGGDKGKGKVSRRLYWTQGARTKNRR